MLDHSIAKGLESMSCLTRMHFALYDDKQHMVASSSSQDTLLSELKTNSILLQDRYKVFIDRQLKLALIRHEPFSVQGPTGQYHTFIPLHCEGGCMTILVEAFYSSVADFERFYFSESGQALGISKRSEEEWLKDIRIYSSEEITPVLEHIRSILQTLIASEFDNKKLSKYSQQSKTIISIMSDVNSNYSVHNIYQIVIDAVIFLFGINTAAIFTKKDGRYHPEVLEGSKKQLIQDLRLSDDNKLITRAATAGTTVSTMNNHELLHAGFPEDMNFVTLFPVNSDTCLLGILAIFNSSIDAETCQSITNLCKITAYLCGISRKREELETTAVQLNLLSIQASSLYPLYRDRSRLYEGIVSEASNLAGAEKCSLMMAQDNGILEVRASMGGNQGLMENVRVRRGEGISGQVYEQGLPVLVNGKDEIRRYGNAPRSHYKTLSSLSLPLNVADEIIGVLNLSDKRSGSSFIQSDISLLSPFLLQVSALLKLGVYYDNVEELKKLSMTDSLTTLFNRRYFDIRLEEEFLRAKRYSLVLSLAILDIDDFKPFNDTEGHLAGDIILKEVAYIMTGAVRSHDILARFGGEEFAIIMPQTSGFDAFRISERIRENIKRNIKPTWKQYHKNQLTISSGITTYPECGTMKEEILRYADKALYRAKNLGKDRTILWK
jgi:diguanylate cyclase (GGDEF)-like protein